MQTSIIKPVPRRLHQTDYTDIHRFINANPLQFAYPASWFNDNWHIFIGFYSRVCQLINKGRTHYSARTIVEVMRFESIMSDTDKTFKINNNASPDLARAFVVLNPDYIDFFQYNRGGAEFKKAIKELNNKHVSYYEKDRMMHAVVVTVDPRGIY